MKPIYKKSLFWSPRVICILFTIFLSLFALDVFDGRHGIWQTLLAFLIHLIPVGALAMVLLAAWRWEWIGAMLFPALGVMFILWPPRQGLDWSVYVIIAGPLFLLGGLFLLNWLYRAQIRSRA